MLTLYELMHGEMTVGQGVCVQDLLFSCRLIYRFFWLSWGSHADACNKSDFHGMDQELFKRALNTLVKRGKAQVFGSEDQQGVKFFDKVST